MEQVLSILRSVFGVGVEQLAFYHILARCFFIYILGIALIRIGKKRFIGKLTVFNTILAIIIGSLLSKAITDKDLFPETVLASLFLIVLHWIFSFIAAYSDAFGDVIKGHSRILIHNGTINQEALRKSNLSRQDLMKSLRLNAKTTDVSKIKEARLERNGDISVLLQEE